MDIVLIKLHHARVLYRQLHYFQNILSIYIQTKYILVRENDHCVQGWNPGSNSFFEKLTQQCMVDIPARYILVCDI